MNQNDTINSNTFITIPLKVEITEGGGDTGASLIINDVRVAGPGPWIGEHVIHDFYECNLMVNIADQPAYRNLQAILDTEREMRSVAEDDLRCLKLFLEGKQPAEYRLHIKAISDKFTAKCEVQSQLLKRAASVIDKLMGDSDLESDESEEMKVCQAINSIDNSFATGWLSPEKVKVLREALELAFPFIPEFTILGDPSYSRDKVEQALAATATEEAS